MKVDENISGRHSNRKPISISFLTELDSESDSGGRSHFSITFGSLVSLSPL
jgi:hypothetical protein